MKIAGIVLIFILLLRFIFNKNGGYKFFLFKLSILIALFVNIGYFYNGVINLSYVQFIVYYYVVFSLLKIFFFKENEQFTINKRLISIVILIACVILGLYNLKTNSNLAYIVPMNVVIDDVAYGIKSLELPILSKANISAFRELVVFCLYCYFSYEYFREKKYLSKLIDTLIKYFHILFAFIIVESIIDNCLANNLVRELINYCFGISDKTYVIAQQRYGLYSAYGLFVEPSHLGAVILIYYSISYLLGFKEYKDKIYFLLSFLVIILSGSSTSFINIPIGILVAYKYFVRNDKKSYFKWGIIVLFIPIIILILIILFNKRNESINAVIEYTQRKIIAYVNSDRSDGSAYARSFGNNTCYGVLKINPILGVGLGTTRGFGLIPGILSNLGILGTLAYIYFLKCNLYIKINRGNILLLIINIIYLTATFSVWHIYMPTIIGIFLFLNRNIYDRKV